MYVCGKWRDEIPVPLQFPDSLLFFLVLWEEKEFLGDFVGDWSDCAVDTLRPVVSTQAPIVRTRQTVQPGCDINVLVQTLSCGVDEVKWTSNAASMVKTERDASLMGDSCKTAVLFTGYISSSVVFPTDHIVFCKLWREEKSVWS